MQDRALTDACEALGSRFEAQFAEGRRLSARGHRPVGAGRLRRFGWLLSRRATASSASAEDGLALAAPDPFAAAQPIRPVAVGAIVVRAAVPAIADAAGETEQALHREPWHQTRPSSEQGRVRRWPLPSLLRLA